LVALELSENMLCQPMRSLCCEPGNRQKRQLTAQRRFPFLEMPVIGTHNLAPGANHGASAARPSLATESASSSRPRIPSRQQLRGEVAMRVDKPSAGHARRHARGTKDRGEIHALNLKRAGNHANR